MSEIAPNRSARIIGQDYGLTAVEMNFLLKEEGFLDGAAGMYSLTDKGKQFASEEYKSGGTGGYAHYNPSYVQTTWDPSITDELDITDERKQQIRQAVRVARQQKAALSAAHAAAYDSSKIDSGETCDSRLDPRVVVVGGLVLAAVSIYGIIKVAPSLKTLWTDKAAPSLKKLKNRRAPGDAEAQAESPDSDEDAST